MAETKWINRPEFIIIGFNAAKAGSGPLGHSIFRSLKDDALTYAGKGGTGYMMEEPPAGIYKSGKAAWVDLSPDRQR